MKCLKCQFENPEGMKFCGECGTKLERVCPHCHFSNPPQFKFCGECGHNLTAPSEPSPRELSFDEKISKIQRYLPKGLTEKILSQRDKIVGERKQVTVMFCDMEGFTPLVEKLGPDEAYDIMDQVYELLIHKVYDYEGTVNEMTGDGIMALFGAPIALEDAPQRALRSAYAIQREMTKFNQRLREERRDISPPKMRIGIHSGPVVVGTLGNDLRVEFKAVGDTVNLASRMEGMAEPGTSYVTEETFKLTEGLFRFEALGEKKVKGKEEPVRVYRVIAPSNMRTRFDVSAERGLTKFVGRGRDLDLLLDGFERSKGRRGQVFSIIAEAGVGKSRLLYEFRKAIANEDVIFLEGLCLSYGRNMAYHPVIDILRANFNIKEGDGDYEIKEKIERGLKVLGVDESSIRPYLLELFSVKDSGIAETPISPEVRKDRIIEAIKRITLAGAEFRPIVMAVEDLHWIDENSEELFKHILDSISGARVFLIMTYRPEFVPTWSGKSYHNQVNLNRLSNRESLAMVSNLLGTEEVDTDLEELILNKAEGIPFFIEEFVKSLGDLGFLERTDGKCHLAKAVKELTIPVTIQDMIMARIDSMPESAKELLRTGSVIGREFTHELIRAVTALSEQELLTHLSLLKDSELVYERGIYPGSTYIFKHALTQEVGYGSLLSKIKKELHGSIGRTLEEIHRDRIEEFCEMLAHHYSKCDDIEKALEYLFKAGEKAKRNYANDAAIAYFTKGLELLKSLPETHERAKQELDFQIALGVPLIAIKGNAAQEVETTYIRARELCEQIADNSQLFQVLVGLRRVYFARGESVRAHELGEQLHALCPDLENSAHLSRAYIMLAETLYSLGEFAQVREQCKKVIGLCDPEQQRTQLLLYGTDALVVSWILEACALWHLGYPDQALKMSNEGLARAQDLSHPFNLAYAFFFSATVHQFRREVHVVRERAEALIQFANEQAFPLWKAWGTFLHGWALVEQGDRNEGIAQMRQALKDCSSMEILWFSTYSLALLAEAHSKAGQAKEGLIVLGEALERAHKSGERLHEAELYRINGELLLMQGAAEPKVEECFHQALEVTRNHNAKALELRAAMSLSRLWQKQDKKEDARTVLEQVYGWFTEGYETADLKEAKALLEALS
jgi:class 3 adenylate cyclase/predicted ATPase